MNKKKSTQLQPDTQAVILFDGVCNLCNASINFVIYQDSSRYFRYAPLQSATGQKFLKKHKLSLSDFDSLVLSEGSRYYTKSTAALRIARKMDGAWPLLYAFIILPPFIRNLLYTLVATNRYRWFGRQDECRMPSPELKQLFLD